MDRQASFLGKPLMDKHTSYYEGNKIRLAISAVQGWRRSMEDSYSADLSDRGGDYGVFGVYDGHGGSSAAVFCRDHMAECIRRARAEQPAATWKEVLESAFFTIDDLCRKSSAVSYEGSGCTATCVVFESSSSTVHVANVGDCRCVLVSKTKDGAKVTTLSVDHKPTIPEEQERIQKNQATVTAGRINGLLAVSRAIGDYAFKASDASPRNTTVTALPHVTSREVVPQQDYLIVASDGLWDVCTDAQLAQIFDSTPSDADLTVIVEKLAENGISKFAGKLGSDNTTVMIAQVQLN